MTTREAVPEILNLLGEEVEDAGEETFLLFSQSYPSSSLGMIDDKADSVTVEVAGREYDLRQSLGLLRSNRNAGTTGAVLWKITPLVANWLADKNNALWQKAILTEEMTVVELGCGIAGLVGMSLAPQLFHYILTDQKYVMKILHENVTTNIRQVSNSNTSSKVAKPAKTKQQATFPNLDMITLDWEEDTAQRLREVMRSDENVNMVLLCDCVYNDFLVRPLVDICAEICKYNNDNPSVLLIAQQLRSDDVFQEWMGVLLGAFRVWRVLDTVLPPSLASNSGYVVHLAFPRLPSAS